MRDPILVLKFGGSVLRSEEDLPRVVHEIYRWYRQGYRVLAVVSAFSRVTDDLFAKARSACANASVDTTAALVATGESCSAALLGLALDRSGVPASILDAAAINLQTRGERLDADPVSLDSEALLRHLQRRPVAIVPGFVGREEDGSVSLLGRGGSDLTALFLAQRLNARCRLIKDVDGLYEFDPADGVGSSRRYSKITYREALALGGEIVQPKAIRFAQEHGLLFEVGAPNLESATVVGTAKSVLSCDEISPPPLRIGALGLGTVGLGVFQKLLREPELFEISGVAVLDPSKKREFPIPPDVAVADAWSIVAGDCDVVIELIGGLSPAAALVRAALERGKHVVTANKVLVAAHGEELQRMAEENDVEFLYSAAVGGAVPMLETVRRIAAEREIVEISGVLNGTCNFVLDKIASGLSWEEAVRLAQANGFAEADPLQDLDGSDAAQKLSLLAHAAFDCPVPFEEISRGGIVALSEAEIRELAATGRTLRLIARASRATLGVECGVCCETVASGHPFANISGEENCLELKTASGHAYTLRGRGAGRWPTAEAVLADVLDLWRASRLPAPSSEEELLVGGAA